MKILVVEDEPVTRRRFEATLEQWGYDVVAVPDGERAIEVFESAGAPPLVILDWMLPGRSGPEVCRHVRGIEGGNRFYILLVTAKAERRDRIVGLRSGADDFIVKPFDREELEARLKVGERIVELQDNLARRVDELEAALAEVHTLRGLLPICSYCKRIREGEDFTQSVEAYFEAHSEARFSHGVCPECYERHVKPQLERLPD